MPAVSRLQQSTPSPVLALCMLLLLLSSSCTLALPNIQQQAQAGSGNYVQQLDKSYFQPPEIEQTIDEVQKILANDPALPRLTRGEIEELYEKVTREEYEKSIEAGDMSRADSMRALMLVLPFNTDNNTEENLQELYTRQPVTRVIDGYTPPVPIKFQTPDPSAMPRSTVPAGNAAVAATTYKPAYSLKKQLLPAPQPTTYHPAPAFMYQMKPSLPGQLGMDGFQPVTQLPYAYDYRAAAAEQIAVPQRFSSHYNAKNAEFLRKPRPAPSSSTTSTVKPVADILESLGIVGGAGGGQTYKRYAIDDYYPAESAPQPIIADLADLRGLQGARIKPDAYTNFKPLNIGEELRVKPEVEGYLTRFGIVKKSSKALKKSQAQSQSQSQAAATVEPVSAQTVLSTSRVPPQGNAELAKLLENLQELERLQANAPKRQPTTTTTSTTSTTTTSTTTTTTTEAPPKVAPTVLPTAQLITHGEPLLIEPKKPRRRIDPNIDINFANAGNQQATQTTTDELSKLLENLQELEKLKIKPEHALKAATPATQALSNRFSATAESSTKRPVGEVQELQLILRQLQQLEQANAAKKAATSTTTTKTTTTSTTTRKPARTLGLGNLNGLGANDLEQLQRLFSDDRELERLYEQARNSKKLAKSTAPTTTTTTTSTTAKPPSVDLSELQAYFAQLERATRPPATAAPTTVTTSSTTTTTRRPPKTKPPVDHAQFQELITRVHQLELLNQAGSAPTTPTADLAPSSLGFTTRNILAPAAAAAAAPSLPSNDFAQLQQLATRNVATFGAPVQAIEISTAATASKKLRAELELSNETGASLLPEVKPQDYVQLQKLLSKVQELERVQLQPQHKSHALSKPTPNSQLVTAASVRTQNVKSLNGAQIVYAQPAEEEDLRLDLPVYRQPTKTTTAAVEQSSSEELRELVMSQPAHPQHAANDNKQFEQYQQFFSSLEDNAERQSYQNMQPIYKTVAVTSTPAPPRFVPAKRPSSTPQSPAADLAELQKLLYNAQELKKLGVALPNELSQQLETKLQHSSSTSSTTTSTTSSPSTSTTPASISSSSSSAPSQTHDSSSPAVFSLTTVKPSVPREPRPPTTESNIELPVFSATKIIEAAIKRAANRIGVSTEQSLGEGFRRRSDDEVEQAGDMQAGVLDGDLMAEFSELNYQLALPSASTAAELPTEPKMEPLGENLSELQRLISNLQQLQQLNVSLSPQSQADAKYLASLKDLQLAGNETIKARRQSTESTTTTPITSTVLATTQSDAEADANAASSTQAPTKISLSLGLSDEDTIDGDSGSSSSSTSTTTEESRNGSLDDLADSFGPDPISEEPPAAKKKNGFYFLADWNSFLEVGDGDDQVVVRLSPKIGDPRNFYPVKTP